MLARYIASDYDTPSLHDVHRTGSPVRLVAVDPLGLGHQSSRGFPYALSKTDSSREVAGYDLKHLHCGKDGFAERLCH